MHMQNIYAIVAGANPGLQSERNGECASRWMDHLHATVRDEIELMHVWGDFQKVYIASWEAQTLSWKSPHWCYN